jgi:hypothetical protein
VVVVAGLLTTAAIHLNLYAGEDYDRIPTSGWLFLLTVITAFVLAVAVSLIPHPVVGLAVTGFSLGVLGGYVLSLLLPNGIFLFMEPGVSYSGAFAIVAEVVAAAAGLNLARLSWHGHGPPVLPGAASS